MHHYNKLMTLLLLSVHQQENSGQVLGQVGAESGPKSRPLASTMRNFTQGTQLSRILAVRVNWTAMGA